MPVPLLAAAALAQTAIGAGQAASGQRRLRRLLSQRETYKTPNEVFEANQLAEQQAQTGFGSATMSYFTNNANRGLTGALNTLTELGGDPNDVAGIFDNYFQSIFKIGAENEQVQIQKFNKVYDTLDQIKIGKDAEYASEQALLKDKMAAEGQQVLAGQQNLNSGINSLLGSFSQMQQSSLFKTNNSVAGAPELPSANTTNTLNGLDSNLIKYIMAGMKAGL